jgi:hypothetical protein
MISKSDQANRDRFARYQRSFFHSGERIPTSGIYRVNHGQHRLPHEVTLLEGSMFPPCAGCNYLVFFELLQAAPHLAGEQRFAVKLHAIPPMADDEPTKIAS